MNAMNERYINVLTNLWNTGGSSMYDICTLGSKVRSEMMVFILNYCETGAVPADASRLV